MAPKQPQTGAAYPPKPKAIRSKVDRDSVVVESPSAGMLPIGDYVLTYAAIADGLPPWGVQLAGRDRELRRFWPTENVLSSAIYSTCAKYAGIEFHLDGPSRTVGQIQRMLNGVQFGEGWIAMWMRGLADIFTQDNGGFIEVVRSSDRPDAPVVSLNHLDANRCIRTGWRDQPVIYYDAKGNGHLLQWYQVMPWAEFPCPIEALRGIQYCVVTRLLRAAQIMRDITIYKREKVSGQFNRGIYFVSGVQQKTIRDLMAQQKQIAANEGTVRYLEPLVVASLDPGATVSVASIDFAKLPDGFDEGETMRWYVNQLALAFGGDYQDFSPLPGGNLGTSQQSATLHMKSRNKGARLFMKMVEHRFNYFGIVPSNVRFVYKDPDPAEEAADGEMRMTRAKERAQRILSGEITVEIARVLAAQSGDLPYDLLLQLNEKPLEEHIDISGGDPIKSEPGALDVEDESKYEGTPADQEGTLVIAGPSNANAPQNSNSGGPGGGMVPKPAGADKKKLVPTKNGRGDSGGAAGRALVGRGGTVKA